MSSSINGAVDALGQCDEFECTDCRLLIFSFPAQVPAPTRCYACIWLEEFVEPAERAALRTQMGLDPCV